MADRRLSTEEEMESSLTAPRAPAGAAPAPSPTTSGSFTGEGFTQEALNYLNRPEVLNSIRPGDAREFIGDDFQLYKKVSERTNSAGERFIVYDVYSPYGDKTGTEEVKESGLNQGLKIAAQMAAMVASIAVPGVGAAIGSTITSALGVSASAAVNAAIGNTIMNAVMNGGDIGKAVQATVAQYAGAQLGQMAGNAANGMFGNATAAKVVADAVNGGVRAIVSGQNPEQAVLGSLVNNAVTFATSQIPDFNKLPDAAKNAISSSIGLALQGKDINAGNILTNAAKEGLIAYGLNQIPEFKNADARTQSFISTMLRTAVDKGDLSKSTVDWAIGQAKQELQSAIASGKISRTDTGDETSRLIARFGEAPPTDTGNETARLEARYGTAPPATAPAAAPAPPATTTTSAGDFIEPGSGVAGTPAAASGTAPAGAADESFGGLQIRHANQRRAAEIIREELGSAIFTDPKWVKWFNEGGLNEAAGNVFVGTEDYLRGQLRAMKSGQSGASLQPPRDAINRQISAGYDIGDYKPPTGYFVLEPGADVGTFGFSDAGVPVNLGQRIEVTGKYLPTASGELANNVMNAVRGTWLEGPTSMGVGAFGELGQTFAGAASWFLNLPQTHSLNRAFNEINAAAETGVPQDVKDQWKNWQEKVGKAEGFWGTIWAGMQTAPENWKGLLWETGKEILQEIPTLGAGLLVRGTATGLTLAEKVAARLGVGVATAMEMLENGGAAYNEAVSQTLSKLEPLVKEGKMTREEAVYLAHANGGEALFYGAGITGVVSNLPGGNTLIEQIVGGNRLTGAANLAKAIETAATTGGKSAVKEFFTEATEEGLTDVGTQYAVNQKVNPQQAAYAAITGGFVGGLTTGSLSTLDSLKSNLELAYAGQSPDTVIGIDPNTKQPVTLGQTIRALDDKRAALAPPPAPSPDVSAGTPSEPPAPPGTPPTTPGTGADTTTGPAFVDVGTIGKFDAADIEELLSIGASPDQIKSIANGLAGLGMEIDSGALQWITTGELPRAPAPAPTAPAPAPAAPTPAPAAPTPAPTAPAPAPTAPAPAPTAPAPAPTAPAPAPTAPAPAPTAPAPAPTAPAPAPTAPTPAGATTVVSGGDTVTDTRVAAFPDFIIGLGGVRRPVDPYTGLAYQTQVGGAPMLGWRGGQLRLHNGIVYEGDLPAFGLAGNQVLRALPPEFGPSLVHPGGENLSAYSPAALVGYKPPAPTPAPPAPSPAPAAPATTTGGATVAGTDATATTDGAGITGGGTTAGTDAATSAATTAATAAAVDTATNVANTVAADVASNTATNATTQTGVQNAVDAAVNTAVDAATNAATDTATTVAADTATNAATQTGTATNVQSAVDTAVGAAVNAATNAATNTAVNTATNTATNVATTPVVATTPAVATTPTIDTTSNVATNVATTPNVATNVATNAATNVATTPTVDTATNVATNAATNVATTPTVDTATNVATNAATNVATTPNVATNVATTPTVDTATNVATTPTTQTSTTPATQTSTTPATQTSIDARIDTLMQQGMDYQTATRRALEDMESQIGRLSTGFEDYMREQIAIQERQLEERRLEEQRRQEEQRQAQQRAQNQQTMQQALTTLGVTGAAAQPFSEYYAKFKDPFMTKVVEQKFESPLDAYLREVDQHTKLDSPFYTDTTKSPDRVAQPSLDMDYFNYGKTQDVDDILRLDEPQPESGPGSVPGSTFSFASGGIVPAYSGGGALNVVHFAGKPRIDFRHGSAVHGPGDGQSDDIPAMLADGEYVFDAETVAALGNGSTKAGADALDKMRLAIRKHKRSGPLDSIPPPSKSPLEYLSMGKKGKK